MSTYAAFVRKNRLPSTSVIKRALSSRGWAVEIDTEHTLDELSGKLPLRVDDEPIEVAIECSTDFGRDTDSDVWAAVHKLTDVRIRFTGDGQGARWARDIARGVALLACGAYLADGAEEPIHYGR
ncbi:MAG TPA: hypothetical protein QGF58_27065 [Myxococcota bacterium]|jgi:hypothetical protein|nr:hypothetical protein [Myxococcota bacterium]